MKKTDHLPFSNLIFASIKDLKNSLGQLYFEIEDNSLQDGVDLTNSHYEVMRMENVLNQLHGLYLLECGSMVPKYEKFFLSDIIDEVLANIVGILKNKNIDISVFDEDESWYLDRSLIESILKIVLLSAARYTEDKIDIYVESSKLELKIIVIDNGNGYTNSFIETLDIAYDTNSMEELSSQMMSWLYCKKVIELHQNQGRKGYINLENIGNGFGGRVEICIP